MSQRFFNIILLFGTGLVMMGTLLFFHQKPLPLIHDCVAQNTNNYFGPTEKIPGNQKLVNVQILIYDKATLKEGQIESVTFYGKSIPLKPRDVYGFRGQGSFKVPPGKYRLIWKVQKDSFAWPRDVTKEEEVDISPSDMWLQISIVGEEATIS